MNELWLARHGQTEWSLSRKHTSVTDVDLTAAGVRQAEALGARLSNNPFDRVLSSPSIRARRTAEIAGFAEGLEIDDDLIEYRYGDYEGRTSDEIRRDRPDWNLWRDGCPGGETTEEVAQRADRILGRLQGDAGTALIFSHGHMTRILAARSVGLDGVAGGLLMLGTATLSIIGREHGRPAIRLWNDGSHLVDAAGL
ncbi:MAG: histidine phosphatase family protein [Actinomycetota bacterium]|nr:histidine phosphatase family protein [Actinomycetota bacterium]